MQKHIYKAIILTIIFVAALFFMSNNIREEEITLEKAVAMPEATFPFLYIEVGGYMLNRLHGYSSNIDASIIREAMVPIGQEKDIRLVIRENETRIKKIKYELRKLKDNVLLDSGTVSALDATEEGKSARIKLEANLDTSIEYASKITAITDEGRKIHYYIRVKYYEDDRSLEDKLAFVTDFHAKSFDKERVKELAMYLETDGSMDNSSFARVTIHSNMDMISWGDLNPEILTELVPTIKEYTKETASIQLEYFIRVNNDSGEETYRVKEFYRIRHTASRIYLLKYERTMEALFDIRLTSMARSEFKLGVTGEDAAKVVTSGENGKVAFVRNGELWYYNLAENKVVRVFSFRGEKEDYFRNEYDQHDIQILNLDDDGNMDFVVYGYMNRGDYEGKVALVLYRYQADADRIRELVYIPLETTYQMLREDISDFSYVSRKGVYYFTIDNRVYSYNIPARRLKVLVENIGSSNFAVMEGSMGIAWVTAEEPSLLRIMDLETEQLVEISARQGERIRIFGSIQTNVLYGYVREEDITETADGTVYIPAYSIEIADLSGKVVKEYAQENAYVVDSRMNGNVVQLSRVQKVEDGYVQISEDSILTQGDTRPPVIRVVTRKTKLMLSEQYLSLPDGFAMEERPKVVSTLHSILSEDTTLHLQNLTPNAERYYVYVNGQITAAYAKAADAVRLADEGMGVVVNQDNRIIFERSGRFNRKALGQIREIKSGNGISSIGACLSMVLRYNQVAADARELSSGNRSIVGVLEENIGDVLNMTGCSLDEVLYCVSWESPVIAMKDAVNAVVITGYDEFSVTYFDPLLGSVKTSMTKAGDLFETAGNIFISYIH